MSNGIGLILAIVLAFALVACLFVLVVVIRRSPARIAAQPPIRLSWPARSPVR